MYESATALCPYYREHGRGQIRCEGGRGIVCREAEDIKRIVAAECSTQRWRECPIAVRLNERYAEMYGE